MKFFVAYVVDFKPCFWHDVNSQMVSHAKVEAGECEPMCYKIYQQAMKVMCSTRSRKQFFVQGCYAVLDENSLPDRYDIIGAVEGATRKRVEEQAVVKKRASKTLSNVRNLENVYCIRYTAMLGWRWLTKEGDWTHTGAIKDGTKTLRGFKTKLAAQEKMRALGRVTPSIRSTSKVVLIEEFPETKETTV